MAAAVKVGAHRRGRRTALPAGQATHRSMHAEGHDERNRHSHEALALDPIPRACVGEATVAAASEEAELGLGRGGRGIGRAREALARALALEPNLRRGTRDAADPDGARAGLARWPEASLSQGRGTRTGNAFVLHQASNLAGNMGCFDEAIGLARRSVDGVLHVECVDLFLSRNDTLDGGPSAEAVVALRKSLEIAPQRAAARGFIALCILAQGRGDEALAEALRDGDAHGRESRSPLPLRRVTRQAIYRACLHDRFGVGCADAAVDGAIGGELSVHFPRQDRAFPAECILRWKCHQRQRRGNRRSRRLPAIAGASRGALRALDPRRRKQQVRLRSHVGKRPSSCSPSTRRPAN